MCGRHPPIGFPVALGFLIELRHVGAGEDLAGPAEGDPFPRQQATGMQASSSGHWVCLQPGQAFDV